MRELESREKSRYFKIRRDFFKEFRRIFIEEHTCYYLDDLGGVHLNVDEQFEVARASTVQGLGDPRYSACLASLEAGYKALDSVPGDGREAIKQVFDAAENLFKLMFPHADKQGQPLVHKCLKPALVTLLSDTNARRAGEEMCEGFSRWVTAAHKYRHASGGEDPNQPPLDLAVLMVSQGTAFVR